MHGALSIHFTAIAWRYEGKGGWTFLSLPEEDSARIREMFKSKEQGWGRLKVEATIVRRAGRDARSKRGAIEMPDMQNELNTFIKGRLSEVKRDEAIENENASNLTSHVAPRAPHYSKTAIWFDTKKNTYLLPIKADIRNKEGIDEGDEVVVTVRI